MFATSESDNYDCYLQAAFQDLVYQRETKEKQDAFILHYISAFENPNKKYDAKQRFGRITIQYMIRKTDNNLISVCAPTFQSVTGLGKANYEPLISILSNVLVLIWSFDTR